MINDYMTREGVAMPTDYRRKPVFCAPVPSTDNPIKVSPTAVPVLLALPMYQGVDTADLISHAKTRLARVNRRSIINPNSRVSAIAVLAGVVLG